ncbi:hypothetical protein FKX85_11405 [Echinicola soli]|uniref:Uncharacterized protein n=1 Tax=Echinicola soli TaxID=2591634 RepID=A0A514CIF7_9BACT|nr:hypothetical protein [Echinicola soli]QDH79611.1 hypothetical protein FKX85_11405 [Echinicola soli]
MWIRIEEISIRQIDANHLENPKSAGGPMVLNLFQREGRTVFSITRNKKVYPQYLETPASNRAAHGIRIPNRKWTNEMKAFAQQELGKIPPQKGIFKITIVGWLFLLLAFGTLGYLVYEGIQAPAKAKKHQQEMAVKATVSEGDVYFGKYRVYKEKGNFIGSEGGFGWFKVVKVENGTYYIAKSVEMSDTAKPKEQLNSNGFEKESMAVKAKELGAYHKSFASGDGLIEISFSEKKNE